ncbi:MAG: hypothetical protein Q7S40_24420 [Opitutaceae bacterium]|nr:hypothetical protein [Opitutaceae bacterium]
MSLDVGCDSAQPSVMSSVLKTLRQQTAPELNFLFTIPPAETPVGWDCGWRGHEHAFHAFFVARMFGAAADLRTGDFAILSRLMPPLATLEREPKHAWCSVGELTPVDLSITFAFFQNVPQLRTAITGEGPNGDWQVRYAEDDSILDEGFESDNEIVFIERQIDAQSPAALLEDPQRFLPPRPAAATDNWLVIHGPEIHAQIALHCYRCAAGGGRSIRNRATRDDAVAWIAGNYPDARAEILGLIKA